MPAHRMPAEHADVVIKQEEPDDAMLLATPVLATADDVDEVVSVVDVDEEEVGPGALVLARSATPVQAVDFAHEILPEYDVVPAQGVYFTHAVDAADVLFAADPTFFVRRQRSPAPHRGIPDRLRATWRATLATTTRHLQAHSVVWTSTIAGLLIYVAFAWLVCHYASNRTGRPLLRTDAEPLCLLPLPPIGCMCGGPSKSNTSATVVDFKRLMKIEGDSLQVLMEEYKGMSAAVWDFASADTPISDLFRLVEASSFSSKSLLTQRLRDVQGGSRNVTVAIDRLGRRLLLCADSTLNANDFAMRTIAKDLPTLFERLFPTNPNDVRPIVRESFELSLDAFSTCINDVGLLSWDLDIKLNAFGQSLDALEDISTLEGRTLARDHDQLLGRIWSLLGGNAQLIRENEDNLLLIALISNFYTKGATHVNNTITAVDGVNHQIAAFRGDVVAAKAPYSAHTLQPLERQLRYIGLAMARIVGQIADHQEQFSGARKKAFARAGLAN